MSEAGGLRRASYGGAGAGEGNRTLVVSLGSFCSTIELHPHFNHLAVFKTHFLQWFLQQEPTRSAFAVMCAVGQWSRFNHFPPAVVPRQELGWLAQKFDASR